MEESSVLFNLNEIMKLERERVTAEEAAVRAAEANAKAEREARAREERERIARAQAEAAERERAAVAAAERAAHEQEAARAATVLRLKLEAEAKQRLALQELELAHATKLHEVEQVQRRKRASTLLAASLITVCLGAGATYAYVLEPALRATRDRSAALDQLTAEAAAQNQALTQQMRELLELRNQEANPSATAAPSEVTATKPAQGSLRPTKRTTTRPAVTQPKPDTLDNLCKGSDDPLCGLDAPSSTKRKR